MDTLPTATAKTSTFADAYEAIRVELRRIDHAGEAHWLGDEWMHLVRLKRILTRGTRPMVPGKTELPQCQRAYDMVTSLLTRIGVPADTDWTTASLEQAERAMAQGGAAS